MKMKAIAKVVNVVGEVKIQKIRKEEKDYSGMIAGGIFLAMGVTIFILSAMGLIGNW